MGVLWACYGRAMGVLCTCPQRSKIGVSRHCPICLVELNHLFSAQLAQGVCASSAHTLLLSNRIVNGAEALACFPWTAHPGSGFDSREGGQLHLQANLFRDGSASAGHQVMIECQDEPAAVASRSQPC